MDALDDISTYTDTNYMVGSDARIRLEEEAAQVAARWAASLRKTSATDWTRPKVEAVPGEESEEELMRKAVLELGMESRNKMSPWHAGTGNISISQDMKKRHGRRDTMSGFVGADPRG